MASLTLNQGVTLPLAMPQQPPRKTEREKYKRTLYWFGFIEMILGIASCGICVVGVIIAMSHWKNSMISASSGIWCGVIQMMSGIVGLRMTGNSTQCLVKVNMALSMLSAICMAVMFILSMSAAISNSHALMSIYVFLSIIASAGFILNIVHCAFCCAAICCIYNGRHAQVYYSAGQSQIVQLANGQYMLVQGQPLVVPGYPGPPMLGGNDAMPALLQPDPAFHDNDSDKDLSPPPYTSTENINIVGEGTSAARQ